MKQKKIKTLMFVVIIISTMIVLSSCRKTSQIDYYSNADNYIEATGIVEYFSYNEDMTALYIELSNLTPSFDDVCFKIEGENMNVIKDKGIDTKLMINKEIIFVSASKYFGDGYVFPIVALSIDNYSLLEFDEGVSNYLKHLENS